MNNLNSTLRQLLQEAQEYTVGSWQRQQKLSQLYRLVMKSGKLWKENTPYYSDALQQMWEYCYAHLEEYDPNIKEVITWLDDDLKKQLRRFRDTQKRQEKRSINPINKKENTYDLTLVDNLISRPDIEAALDIWQETLNWVQTDPQEKLRKTCFRQCPNINCQALFLKRFPEEIPWQTIAEQYELSPTEAKDLPKWYNRRCLKLIREFGISQGYITE